MKKQQKNNKKTTKKQQKNNKKTTKKQQKNNKKTIKISIVMNTPLNRRFKKIISFLRFEKNKELHEIVLKYNETTIYPKFTVNCNLMEYLAIKYEQRLLRGRIRVSDEDTIFRIGRTYKRLEKNIKDRIKQIDFTFETSFLMTPSIKLIEISKEFADIDYITFAFSCSSYFDFNVKMVDDGETVRLVEFRFISDYHKEEEAIIRFWEVLEDYVAFIRKKRKLIKFLRN